MSEWLKAGKDVLDLLLGEPAADLHMWTIIALSLIACIVVLKFMAGAMGGRNAFIDSSVVCGIIGLALILVCFTALKLYVPREFYRENHAWLMPAAGLALSLIVIAPLISALMKTNYLGALVAWGVSIIIVAGVILLASAAFDAIESGRGDAAKIRKRRDALEEILQ